MKKDGIHYAGFFVRAIADMVDSLILDIAACLVGFLVLGVVYWINYLFFKSDSMSFEAIMEMTNSLNVQIGLVACRAILSFLYFSFLTYRTGTTAGKRLLRIYVVSAVDGARLTLKQSMIRCLGYIASYIPFGTGFLMVMFQPEKRALHDLIAGTVCVIRKRSYDTV